MIMKKVFNSLFVIIAAMVTFAGCAKQETDAPATSETKTVQFFANSIETKTHFGDKNDDGKYPTLWDDKDRVKVLLNLESPSGVKGLETIADIEVSEDSKSARFNAEINSEYPFNSYTFYAISPSSAYNAKSSNDGRFTVQIPNKQTPQPASVDKAAQVLYSISATTNEFQSSVQMHFKHFTAYGKLSLINLTDEISEISSVKLSFPVNVVGKWNYFVADGRIEAKEATSEIELTTTSTDGIWFACAPVDVSGKTITLTVTTDKGNLVKEITFPANCKFEAGKISIFTVDMAGITAGGSEEPGETTAYYEKVTSAPADWSGKYLLVVEDGVNCALSGISTTSTKYGLGIEVSIDDNKIIASDMSKYEVVIAKASTSGAYTMAFDSSLLYWTSGNSLAVNSTESANTSWTISLDNGKLSIYNCKDSARQLLWNKNSPRFACYTGKETDAGYYYPHLYKLVGGSSEGGGETPEPEQKYLTVSQSVFNVTADQTSVTFDVNANVGWGLDESEDVETQIVGVSDDELVMTVEVTFPANETAEPKTHTVTFIPEELDENVTVTINQAAKVAVDTNFEAGDYWIIGVEDEISHVMVPFASTSNYAYAPSEVITDNRTFAKYAFTFEAVEGGFNIKASDERYYSTDANYKNFQIKDTPSVWTVSVQNDGTYLITDASTGKTIKYGDSTYTTFGVYASSDTNTGVYPILVKADNPLPVELTSISVTGCTTIFNEGDPFVFDGIVTANYNDGSTKDVTNSAVVTEPNMVNGAEVTVSYTEGTVTKTFNYNITVKAASQGGGDVQEYTYTWTATSGALGTTANGTTTKNLNNVDWTIQRSDNSGYTGWGNNVIQIGSKNNPENLTLKTSAISGTIKSVSVECASYQAKHNISISVGGVAYVSQATPTWSNNAVGTVSCEGNSTGDIEIKFTKGSGARALYIKSIKIVYTN